MSLYDPARMTLSDDVILKKFGYNQELKRNMKRFSSFAISFSLISILTGIFANFQVAYLAYSSNIIFSWMIVFGGQLIVATIMADLSVAFPISGYGYQWSTRLVNNKAGFITGWLLLSQLITGLPGICVALSMMINQMLLDNFGLHVDVQLLSILVVWMIVYVHSRGIKLIANINNIGVITEIAGVVFLILLLLLYGGVLSDEPDLKSPQLVFQSYGWQPFAISILLGAWCLTGFEAAADMAEETVNPSKTIPGSIFLSLILSGIFGLIIIVLFCYLLSGTTDFQTDNVLYDMMRQTFGMSVLNAVSVFIVFSIFACGIACLASSSRLIFSMSRDCVLPVSGILKKVNDKGVPLPTLMVIGVFSTAVILFFKKIEIITSVSALSGYLGYMMIILASFKKNKPDIQVISGKQVYFVIKVLALAWVLFVVIALLVPAGAGGDYLGLVSFFCFLFTGILMYTLKGRK